MVSERARKPETKAQLASAKKNAWEQFTKQFPNADKDQFFVQTSVDEKLFYHRISCPEVFHLKKSKKARSLQLQKSLVVLLTSSSVFGSDRKYWSQKKEDCPWPDRRRRLSFPAIAIETRKEHCQSQQ